MNNPINIAYYPLLADHAIHHWLACGTVTSPLQNLEQFVPAEGSPFGEGNRWIINFWAFHPQSIALKKQIYAALPGEKWQPPLRPVLHETAIANKNWRYAVAEEDQVIDFSVFNLTPALMEGWLYAGIEAPADLTVEANLLTIGPAKIRLNGQAVFDYRERFSYVALQRIPVSLQLQQGWNDLTLYGAMIGWREARLALGLRFEEAYPLKIGIPMGDVSAEKWQQAEANLNRVQVRQFAFPQRPGYVHVESGDAVFEFEAQVTMSIPDLPWAKLDELPIPVSTAILSSAEGDQLPIPLNDEITKTMVRLPGENHLALILKPTDGTPLTIRREIWASQNAFSHSPYGDYESRRQEALNHLASMPHDMLAAMAAVATGKATHINADAVRLACGFLINRCDCADFYAIGLLAALYWHGDSPALLTADQQKIEHTLLNFKFWIDEPGLDGMCYFTENHQVLFHVAAYLTGQRYPDWTFTNSGFSGQEQQSRSIPRIENWIVRRLQGNFSEWDSNAYLALDAFAMLALVEFAEHDQLRKLAETLLHKIFFLVACQSFRGVHGSTHGRCYVQGLKSARFENTSSLQRIGWGMGIFNGETRATGLLALVKNYRVPDVLQKIGADVATPLLTLARSTAEYAPEYDMQGGKWDVSTMTYRTANVMLSAALDYNKGEMGIQEHCWQATLSPEAVVFTTYPGNSQEHGNARPNFWAGSARLPRVSMSGRTVICLYRFEPGVGLGFSHAYFPVAAFDETRIQGNWVFGRVGEGYVALWGDGDLILTNHGRHAGQELRSAGLGQAWLCYVGETSIDGTFADFCQRVQAQNPVAKGASLIWQNPQAEMISFGWDGAMTINGQPQDWSNFPHYANAYTDTPLDADQMMIRYEDEALVLKLGL